MSEGQLFPGTYIRAPDPYRSPKRPQSILFPERVGEQPSLWGCRVQPGRTTILWKLRAGTGAAFQREAFPQPRAAQPSALPGGTRLTRFPWGSSCLQTLALLHTLSLWGLWIRLPEGRRGCCHLFTGEEA